MTPTSRFYMYEWRPQRGENHGASRKEQVRWRRSVYRTVDLPVACIARSRST